MIKSLRLSSMSAVSRLEAGLWIYFSLVIAVYVVGAFHPFVWSHTFSHLYHMPVSWGVLVSLILVSARKSYLCYFKKNAPDPEIFIPLRQEVTGWQEARLFFALVSALTFICYGFSSNAHALFLFGSMAFGLAVFCCLVNLETGARKRTLFQYRRKCMQRHMQVKRDGHL